MLLVEILASGGTGYGPACNCAGNKPVDPAKPKMSNTYDVPPPKINNASISELKSTSDDAIAPVFLPSGVFTNG
jgi:signal peptidase complex subunit 2